MSVQAERLDVRSENFTEIPAIIFRIIKSKMIRLKGCLANVRPTRNA